MGNDNVTLSIMGSEGVFCGTTVYVLHWIKLLVESVDRNEKGRLPFMFSL